MIQILIGIVLLAVILYLAIRNYSLRRRIKSNENAISGYDNLADNQFTQIHLLETQLKEEKQIKENLRNTLNLLAKPNKNSKKAN